MTNSNRTLEPLLKKAALIYCLACAMLYPVIFYARTNRIESISSVLIPVFVTLVFISAATGALIRKTASRWTRTAAFFCIVTGDLAINLTPFIKISAITFSATHILLGLSFLIETGWRKKDPFILLPVLCFSSASFAYNICSIPGTGLAVALGAYYMILSFMLWRAICCAWSDLPWKTSLCVISGAFLFYITDMLVCSYQIHRDDAYIAGVWICYPPALFLLSISDWFRKD